MGNLQTFVATVAICAQIGACSTTKLASPLPSSAPENKTESAVTPQEPLPFPSPTQTPPLAKTSVLSPLRQLLVGQYILFSVVESVSANGGVLSSSLFALSADGTINQHLLTLQGFPVSLSPDRKRVIYLADNHWKIRNLETNSDDTVAGLSSLHCNTPVAWSADSTQIAISCEARIFVVSLLSGDQKELTAWSNRAAWTTPSWSPNGKWIAFEHLSGFPKSVSEEGLYFTEASCLNNPATCQSKTSGPYSASIGCDECVTWSVDSNYLAYATAGTIEIFNLQSSKTRSITLAGNYDLNSISWSPDGEWIAFAHPEIATDGPQITISLVSPDTGDTVWLADAPLNKDKYILGWLVVP